MEQRNATNEDEPYVETITTYLGVLDKYINCGQIGGNCQCFIDKMNSILDIL